MDPHLNDPAAPSVEEQFAAYKKTTRRVFGITAVTAVIAGAAGYKMHMKSDINLERAARENHNLIRALNFDHPATTDADKNLETSVAQIETQIASVNSQIHTQGFMETVKLNPWLYSINKTVGAFTGDNTPTTNPAHYHNATAILLDKDGTIALAAHSLADSVASIGFYAGDRALHYNANVSNLQYDKVHDLMFATISPSDVQKYKLQPVQWGHMAFDDNGKGQDIIAVGFPFPSYRLHAVSGKINAFIPAMETDQGRMECKIDAVMPTFHGMSGAGIFQNGKFIGLLNTGAQLGLNPHMDFTPADLIRKAYVDLYPDRAAKADIAAPDETPATPDVCRISRRNFLSASF